MPASSLARHHPFQPFSSPPFLPTWPSSWPQAALHTGWPHTHSEKVSVLIFCAPAVDWVSAPARLLDGWCSEQQVRIFSGGWRERTTAAADRQTFTSSSHHLAFPPLSSVFDEPQNDKKYHMWCYGCIWFVTMGNPELIMTLNIVTPLPSTLRKSICMPLSLQPHPLYLLPFVTVYRGGGFPARSMQHESPCCCHSNTCLPWQLLSTPWTSMILSHCILVFKIRLCILLVIQF